MLDNTKFESEKCRLNISAPLHTIIGLFLDYGTTEDRTHNSVNEVTAIDTNNDADFLYDSNGNLTKWTDDPEGTPVVKEFLWDDLNRLTKIKVGTSDGTNDEAIFIYDVNNQRVRKEYDSDDDGDIDVNDETIEFVWADGHVIEEYVDGSLDRNYVHGNQFIDELVLFEDSSGDYHYYLQDFRYTVYALVDDTGTVEERYRFDPYGKRTVVTDDGSIDEHYGFTGRYHDDSDETDLIYFRNRWMSGEMGRFVSRDPVEYVDGMNLYAGYFIVNEVDWSGFARKRVIKTKPLDMSKEHGSPTLVTKVPAPPCTPCNGYIAIRTGTTKIKKPIMIKARKQGYGDWDFGEKGNFFEKLAGKIQEIELAARKVAPIQKKLEVAFFATSAGWIWELVGTFKLKRDVELQKYICNCKMCPPTWLKAGKFSAREEQIAEYLLGEREAGGNPLADEVERDLIEIFTNPQW